MNYVRPSLTEPGVTYFLQETLKQCKEKERYLTLEFLI